MPNLKELRYFLPLIASLVMVIGGGVLTMSNQSGLRVFGAVLVALGSAQMSISVSGAKSQLAPVCDQFLEAIAQLRQTNKQFRDGSISEETSGELIASHVISLEETLRNLHAYSGVDSDPIRFRNRRGQTRLEDPPLPPAGASSIPARPAPLVGDRPTREETVQCPNCRTDYTCQLGLAPGDSQTGSCPACQLRFHIHRDRHGGIYTKAWGSGGGITAQFPCPECTQFEFRFRGRHHARYCLECFSLVSPDGEGATVVKSRVDPALGTECGVDEDSGKSVLACGGCGSKCVSFALYRDRLFGICSGCGRLVRSEPRESSPSPLHVDGAAFP